MLSEYELNRQLDVAKTSVFLDKNNSAFLGSIMCSLNFIWTDSVKTCATDGINFFWNQAFFESFTKQQREAALLHEIWHVARLHNIRCGDRDKLIWNYACDIRINNDLEKEGYSFGNFPVWLDQSYGNQPEEQIYEDLKKKNITPPPSPWGDTGDLLEPDKKTHHQMINAVVSAVQQAKMAGQAGKLPGEIMATLDGYLNPIIPWQTRLSKFFTDLLDEDYTWARPNRRYSGIYLPSRFLDTTRLEHLVYYFDVSGSVTDEQARRFNSEVRYIKETFQPEKLTIAQFDTRITKETVLLENDSFQPLQIVGRGGTSFVPVRAHMIKHQPTAAIIFSDMWCEEMLPLPPGMQIPVIWVAISNKRATVPFGEIIHIDA